MKGEGDLYPPYILFPMPYNPTNPQVWSSRVSGVEENHWTSMFISDNCRQIAPHLVEKRKSSKCDVILCISRRHIQTYTDILTVALQMPGFGGQVIENLSLFMNQGLEEFVAHWTECSFVSASSSPSRSFFSYYSKFQKNPSSQTVLIISSQIPVTLAEKKTSIEQAIDLVSKYTYVISKPEPSWV